MNAIFSIRLGGFKTIKISRNKRLQIYYPKCRIEKDEIWLGLDTTFRIVWREEYKGIAFQILGVGIGFDINY